MKKLPLLLFFLLFIAIDGNAKAKISIDKMKDGYRIIQTERTPHIFPYVATMTDAAISLDLWKLNDLENYNICIYIFSDVNVDKGNSLLLKLDNDDVIELKAKSKSETIKNWVFTVLQTITFTNYSITEEQIKQIIEHNVVKVRVETAIDFFDGKVYGNKFSKTIANDYKLIKKALEKDISVYDNF